MSAWVTKTDCMLNLVGRIVQLSVTNESANVWRWRMQLDFAHDALAEGMTATKIAGQVASQLAVEHWLRIHQQQHTMGRYIWIDQVS